MSDEPLPDIPVPSGWAKNVKTAVLHVISMAHYAMASAPGWAANSINARVRLAADNDQLNQEAQLLRAELRIKDVRLAKIDPPHRPYYPVVLRVPPCDFRPTLPRRSPAATIPAHDLDTLAVHR